MRTLQTNLMTQEQIDSLYQMLSSQFKIKKENVKDFLRQSSIEDLIKGLSAHVSNADIENVLTLRARIIADNHGDSNGSNNNNDGNNVNNYPEVRREFKQQSQTVERNYFVPMGNYQTDPNGLIKSQDGVICSSSCAGVITGKFLNSRTESILSYSYTAGQGFLYAITSVIDGTIIRSVSNVVNPQELQAFTNNIAVSKIDVNYDVLEDLVLISTDVNNNVSPVVLLNNQNTPFSKAYQLSGCGSNNGAVQIRTGYFFGTNQPGGLWCQNTNSNMGFFYQVNILNSSNTNNNNLILKASISNWCTGATMVVLDYNGDKYDDAFCLAASQQQLFISAKGLEMVSATADGTGNVALFSISDISNAKFTVGDFDGNGKDDLLRMDNTGNYYLYLSNGKTFFDYQKGMKSTNIVNNNNQNKNAITIGNGGFCDTSSKLLSAKFNHDQKSDLWCSNSNSDKFMLSTLVDNQTPPKVHLSLSYQMFYPISEIINTQYFISSKNYVNALDHDKVQYNEHLEAQIQTSYPISSFRDDLIRDMQIISGQVSYVPQHAECYLPLNGSNIGSYSFGTNQKEIYLFDVISSPEAITANVFCPGTMAFTGSAAFGVLPNTCVTAQLNISTYQHQTIYSAQALATLTDEDNNSLSGQALLSVGQRLINKPVSLTQNDQALVFNTIGSTSFYVPYNVETGVFQCANLSNLQSSYILPKINAKLVYSSFNFTTPDTSGLPTVIVNSTSTLNNSKKYGQAGFSTPLELAVNLNQRIDGFTYDIKTNNLVIDGEVVYLQSFNDIHLITGQGLAGYRLEAKSQDSLKHSWSTPADQISAELLAGSNIFKIKSDSQLNLVPGQCLKATISATLIQDVQILANAKGYFSATDMDGNPITGNELLAIGQQVLNRDLALDSTGNVVFETTNTLTTNIIGNVITIIEDC